MSIKPGLCSLQEEINFEARTNAPTQHFHPSRAEPNTLIEDSQGVSCAEGSPFCSGLFENPVKNMTPEEETTKEAKTHTLKKCYFPSIAELIFLIEYGTRLEVGNEYPLTGAVLENLVSLIKNTPLARNSGPCTI